MEKKEVVGYVGSRAKGGSKDDMYRDFQAYHWTGSYLRGDNGRLNHSQWKQHTTLLIVLLRTTPDVHENRK